MTPQVGGEYVYVRDAYGRQSEKLGTGVPCNAGGRSGLLLFCASAGADDGVRLIGLRLKMGSMIPQVHQCAIGLR